MEAAIAGLIDAIQARAYYPLFAFALTILIAIFARWQPRLFEPQGDKPPIIPERIQWLPALLLAGATAFVGAWSSGLSWHMAVGVALYTMAVGGPATVGVHRMAKEARGRKGEPASGRPPNVGGIAAGVVLFVAVAIGSGAPGCSSAKPILRTVHDVARSLCAIHYAELHGFSVEDAAKAFCSTEEALRPWIDEALRAQRAAAAKATQGDEEPAEDAGAD